MGEKEREGREREREREREVGGKRTFIATTVNLGERSSLKAMVYSRWLCRG